MYYLSKINIKQFVVLFFIMCSVFTSAQIGIGTNTPDNSAVLDVTSTSQGVLIPRMTQAERIGIATPATGLLMYQTDVTTGFYYYNGTVWTTFGSSGWELTGNTGTNSAVDKLGTIDGQDFILGTNGIEAIRIASSGNVGFNSTTPSAKFHLVANSSPVTLLDDGFEDTTINSFTTGGNAGWATTNVAGEYNTASWGAKSGVITHSETSWIEYNTTIPASGGTISFAFRTSTEASYDDFDFLIDGISQNTWNGNVAWNSVSYPVTAGAHTFRWIYAKDSSVDANNDEVYLDDVLVTALPEDALIIDDGSQVAGYVLTSDANGVATWEVPVGSSIIDTDWMFDSGSTVDDPIYHQGNVMIGYNAASAHNLQLWDGVSTSGSVIVFGDVYSIVDGDGEFLFMQQVTPTVDATYNLGSLTKRWKNVYTENGVVNTSDIRLKEAIKPLQYGLKEFLALDPVSFKWKEEKVNDFVVPDNEKEIKLGFIAQEVQKIIPEVVVTHQWKEYEENPGVLVKEKSERLGMRYNDLIPVAIRAIQEQQEKIEKLKANNLKLKQLLIGF